MIKHNKQSITFFPLLILNTLILGASAGDLEEEVNQQLDTKQGVVHKKRGQFIAVPIPVSNPTIGSGLQAALLYLHPPKNDNSLNATSGLGAMYTNTESWLVGLFHDNYLFGDRLRLRTALGTGSVNLDFYGTGSDPVFSESPIEYLIESDLVYLRLLSRIPSTDYWFAGLSYTGMNTHITFNLDNLIPDIPLLEDDMQLSGIGLVVNFDSTNNSYYPTQGKDFEVAINRNNDAWGSDFNYDKTTLSYNQYIPLSKQSTLAGRFFLSSIDGEAPFFVKPSLKMRGFASNRYQDDAATSAHLEWRYKFKPRWGFMLSLEAGEVADSVGQLNGGDIITSVGAGIRWQVAAAQPMHLGLDVGFSDGDSAIYVQVGEKF